MNKSFTSDPMTSEIHVPEPTQFGIKFRVMQHGKQ